MVEVALPSAATSKDRVALLEARDQALDMLRRPADRMEGLAELGALAEALGDTALEVDVRLRRAAALRTAEEEDRAAVLAREVRELAVSRGDARMELAACLELGQDVLHAAIGESYDPAAEEVDLDAAEEPYRRAVELARELGDDASLAAALREIAVILVGRIREWFVSVIDAGEHMPYMVRIAAGEAIEDIVPETPDRADRRRGARAPRGGARAVRAARRPPGRDVLDHRDGVPELGRGHPRRRERGPAHRGDPPPRLAQGGVHERERARRVRGPDALRGARVRAREGDPRPRDLARRARVRAGAGDRRPRARVPRGRRDRARAPRRRRRRGGQALGRPGRRDRRREPDAASRAPARDLARADARRRGRRGGHAPAPRARRRARRRAGPAGRARARPSRSSRSRPRGWGPSSATTSSWTSPSARRARSTRSPAGCPVTRRGARRPTPRAPASRSRGANSSGRRSTRARR